MVSEIRVDTKPGPPGEEQKGVSVRGSSERIILICEECGEKIVLIGPEEVWRSERTIFECECGEQSTLASNVNEERMFESRPTP